MLISLFNLFDLVFYYFLLSPRSDFADVKSIVFSDVQSRSLLAIFNIDWEGDATVLDNQSFDHVIGTLQMPVLFSFQSKNLFI